MASEAVYESPTPVGVKKVVRESTKAFLRRVDTVKELVREGKLKVERENAPLRISDRAFHYAVVLADNLFLPTNKTDCEWQNKILEILNEACAVLRDKIVQEDSVLDEEEYVLRRALVEYNELVKQKDCHSKVWLQRVEREIEEASVKLQSILNRWTLVSMSSRILSPEVSNKLESFSRFLVNTLSSSEAELHGELPDLSQFLQQFGVLKDQLVGMVPNACMDALTVGYEHVAEVVSRLTNIPIPWFYTPAMPESRVKAMRKLHERIVDQDHVLEEIFQTLFHPSRIIVKIAMGTSKRPRGSLLLLGPSGVGKTEIARGIVEHLLCDVNRFIRIDMSEYAELHVVLSPSGSCEMFSNELQQSSFGRLVEAVRERPYSLILFDKIELAHPSVLSIVHKIVTDGELIDEQGHTVVFSNTIVIMTSEVGAYQLGNSCTCANRSSELMEQFKCNPRRFYQTHKCVQKRRIRKRAIKEARSFFNPALLDSLDNILVLDQYRDSKAIARLLLRDSARNFLKGDLVIYPSDAALSEALKICSNIPVTVKNGKAIKSWIDDSVAQVLCNSRSGMEHEHPTVYVDSLVGTNELSFRFETSKLLVEECFLSRCKVSLGKLRAIYRMEKEIVMMLLTMGKSHSLLMSGPVELSDVELLSREVQKFLRCCYLSKSSLLSVHHKVNKDASSSTVADNYHIGRMTEGINNLRKRLQERVIGHKNPAIGFIANALLRSIDGPSDLRNRPFGSYLLLGLNTSGQIELLKGLAEHMKTADGNTLLITIDMQNPLYVGLLVEAVKKNPHSVLLFHRVESADCHSYSTLLKILENGMLAGSAGAVVDFRDATIVLTSDLGNRSLLARLFGHSYLDGTNEGDTLQEKGHLRSELLYRMDEIIFFDPFSLEQREIRRLSMEGPHLNGDGADELLFSLFSIFRKSSDTVCNGGPGDYIVNCLSQALEGTGVN